MTDLVYSIINKYARRIVQSSMRIGKKSDGEFDSVRIVYNSTDPSCEDFALKIEEECWRVGAYTITIPYSSRREKQHYILSPKKSLSSMSPIAKRLSETLDVTIFIGEQDDPAWANRIAEKVRLTSPIRQQLREILDERKVRWLYLGWPIPKAAKYYGVTLSKFRYIFLNAIQASFGKEMLDLVSYYRQKFVHAKQVHITADDGTDITFSIEGRPVLIDNGRLTLEEIAKGDVGLNIPSGEVFIAPLENTANGIIIFNKVVIAGFGRVEKLQLTFINGKIRKFKAKKGIYNFQRFLDANTGEKDRIGELGIGCNPAAEYTGGCTIIDEKIYRTIHVAIGNNTGSYHGQNKASCHLDLIKDMQRGELAIDNIPVMVKGKPVVKS